jgi:hypothetical protein
MKATWTCPREQIAIIPPRGLKDMLRKIFDFSDSKHQGFVTVTIETVRKPRTTGEGSQSHHFNGHVQQIAQETGMPFEAVKLELKHRAIKRGYPILYKADGTAQHDLWGRVMGISEADCSTTECGYLIEEAHELASELGMTLKEE